MKLVLLILEDLGRLKRPLPGCFGHQVAGGHSARLFLPRSMCSITLWAGFFGKTREVLGSRAALFDAVFGIVPLRPL